VNLRSDTGLVARCHGRIQTHGDGSPRNMGARCTELGPGPRAKLHVAAEDCQGRIRLARLPLSIMLDATKAARPESPRVLVMT
jgi:hypothetical protein